MEAWKNIIGNEAKIIFEDGSRHFSKKIGKVIEITATHIILKTGSKVEAILLSKVIRLETIGGII